MSGKRESSRVKDANQRRILDEDARKKRLMKSLADLERDNFHEDPNADLDITKVSKDGLLTGRKKSYPKSKTRFFHKTFFDALSEEVEKHGRKDYIQAQLPPSQYPPRHFCAVCGFFSKYTCVQCGARYCSVKCYGVHKDTRCLKYIA